MALRLRLAEIMIDRDFTPADLAECARVPTRSVMALLQPVQPKAVRLALLDRLALVLDVHPAALLDHEPDTLAARVSVRPDDSFAAEVEQAPDTLADLEAEWRAEFRSCTPAPG